MRRVLAFARACPAASPHIPCAAARSCPCPPCSPCAARSEARATRIWRTPGSRQSDGPARSRASPPCLLRSRAARSTPAPCASHFTNLTHARPPSRPRARRSKNKVGRGIRRGYLRVGPQAAYTLRVGAAAPFLSMRPQRRSQSRGLPEHDVLCAVSRGRLSEMTRDHFRDQYDTSVPLRGGALVLVPIYQTLAIHPSY